jgi:hypothetical protein
MARGWPEYAVFFGEGGPESCSLGVPRVVDGPCVSGADAAPLDQPGEDKIEGARATGKSLSSPLQDSDMHLPCCPALRS